MNNKTIAGNKTLTLEDLLYFQETVIAWNKMFGNSVTDTSLIDVYKSLTEEELLGDGELLDSFNKKDDEGVIDGLVDGVFVSFMWCSLKGLTIKDDDVWFTEGNWNSPLNKIESGAVLRVLKGCLEENAPFDFQTYFVSLLSEMSCKYDLVGAFNRITESNYSKALSKQSELTVDECIQSVYDVGRYEDVFYEETDTHYIIKARIDTQEGKEYPSGKVVKGVWYKSVEDLGGLKEFIK